jgi:DNA adenine methylase
MTQKNTKSTVQLSMFDGDSEDSREFDSADTVVNVASVPQRSPFRYPGGKTWLVPRIRQWLQSFPVRPGMLIEPFAGGAIVSLTAAAEILVDRVELIELDDDIAAVWQTILQDPGGGEWLTERIGDFELTLLAVKQILLEKPGTVRDHAFQTIIKNRVNRGGILAPGAGLIKVGEAGKGLASRWYPATLQKRIFAIMQNKERLNFVQGDGLQIIAQTQWSADTVFFIDPPYTVSKKSAGSRLYTHFDLDHQRLFALMADLPNDFLMTYDDAPEVRALAAAHGFVCKTIAMKNTHHAKQTELLIGRQLDWLPTPETNSN